MKLSPGAGDFAESERVLEGEILGKDDEPVWQQERKPDLPDIEAVINNPLRVAGLIKT